MWHSLCQGVSQETVRLELASSLSLLPVWRRQKALSYRYDIDRYNCAKSYLLLKDLLLTHFGIDDYFKFGYGPYGKPFLVNYPDVHFNISHCHKAIFCAVGDTPIGVDIEEIQYDKALAKQIFSDTEIIRINGSDNPSVEFTKLWTMKESYLKLIGSGLTDDLKSVLDSCDPTIKFDTGIDLDTGVVYSVAVKG